MQAVVGLKYKKVNKQLREGRGCHGSRTASVVQPDIFSLTLHLGFNCSNCVYISPRPSQPSLSLDQLLEEQAHVYIGMNIRKVVCDHQNHGGV